MAEQVEITTFGDLRRRYLWVSHGWLPVLNELDGIEFDWPEWNHRYLVPSWWSIEARFA